MVKTWATSKSGAPTLKNSKTLTRLQTSRYQLRPHTKKGTLPFQNSKTQEASLRSSAHEIMPFLALFSTATYGP
jgi:hypothetical protein